MRSGIIIQLDIIPWYISLPLSYVWLIGIINALNIIDVMDGLSSGVALMCSIIFILVGVMNHSMIIAIIASALGGSLLGFLRYNFEPAQIYLGDTGSMFVGMMMGSLAMIGNFTMHNNLGCFAPVLILGVPIFDTMFVMYIRYRRGMSILTGSPDHFALRLRKWRLSTRQTVTISYAISILLGIAALLIINVSDSVALTIILILIAAGLGTGYFLKRIDMTL
jgi:UDP-GlcNAc:undecaprenyl-phosphate GlcNAc-1-phosphate transferase